MAAVIGYGNLINSATLGGTLTNAANLKTRYLTQKATAGAGAYLDIDLGAAKSIGSIAAISHTQASGAITIVGGTSAGNSSIYNSGALNIYTGSDFAVTFANVSARYWRITFSAASTIGRIFIGPRFKPVNNIDWSHTLEVESKTGISEALGGPEYFDIRPNRRVWRGAFSWLNAAEASTWLDVQRTQDVAGEVYWYEDDTDTTYRGQRWFYGRLRTLSAIEYPYLSTYKTGIEIGELL